MSTTGHGCHGQSLERVRRLTAILATIVFCIGVVSLHVAGTTRPAMHAARTPHLALSSASAHHPHVVELDLPASSTTLVPPGAVVTTTTAVPPRVAPPRTVQASVVHAASASPSSPAAASPSARGAEALARIDYPWQHLGFSITFDGPNDGLLGKANCNNDRIDIYVRPTQTVQQLAFVIAFELGHAVDCGFMNDQTRDEWASIRGFAPGWRWFPGCVCTEDDFGSGDISMVFAHWLVPDGGYRWRSNLAPVPSPEQMQQLLPYLQH